MNVDGLMDALGEIERRNQVNQPGEPDTAVIDTPNPPSDRTNRLRTKAYFIPPGMFPLLDATTDIIANAANAPAPHARNLSDVIFPREYNARTLNRVVSELGNFETDQKAILQAVLSAQAEVRQYEVHDPVTLLSGSNFVVASAGGDPGERYFGLGDLVAMYPSMTEEDGVLQKQRFRTGLEQAPQYMMEHNHVLWVATRDRTKAFDPSSHGLKFTLNSTGFEGEFGVTNEIVFRYARQSKKFAAWSLPQLPTHVGTWNDGEDVDPLGGRLKLGKYGYSKHAATVELSRGTEPTYTFEVPNLTASLSILAAVPNTTKWLTTLSTHYQSSIFSFDLSQPTSAASLAGHAPGTAVKRLVTHEDMPTSFIAAGGDALVRVYDLRDQEPQISLDGHTKPVTSCTVAPSRSRFPIVFTGGEDELIKAWDIRYSKSCLYSLSSGTLEIVQLAWSDSGNSLFTLGKNPHIGNDGRHHGYREVDRVPNPPVAPVREEFDVNAADESKEAEWWPLRSMTPQNFLGKRYCEVKHSVLEYRFKENANIGVFPSSQEPDVYHGD